MRRPAAATFLAVAFTVFAPVPAPMLERALRDRTVAVQEHDERTPNPLDDLLRGPRRVRGAARRSSGPRAWARRTRRRPRHRPRRR